MAHPYTNGLALELANKMSPEEIRLIYHLYDDIAYDKHSLAYDAALPIRSVVLIRKHFAKIGIAYCCILRANGGESNLVAGRGYILTELGCDVKCILDMRGAFDRRP